MPTAMPLPPRALPRRFRQPRLLLVGCGDVAARIARQLHGRYRIRALLRHDVGGLSGATGGHWAQHRYRPIWISRSV